MIDKKYKKKIRIDFMFYPKEKCGQKISWFMTALDELAKEKCNAENHKQPKGDGKNKDSTPYNMPWQYLIN